MIILHRWVFWSDKIKNRHKWDNVDNVWGLIEITDLHRLFISNQSTVWDITEISSEILETHMRLQREGKVYMQSHCWSGKTIKILMKFVFLIEFSLSVHGQYWCIEFYQR